MMTLIGTLVTITFELTYENTSCSTYLNRDRPNMFGKTEPNQTECLAEPDVRQKYAPFAEHVRPKTERLFGPTERSAEIYKFGSAEIK